MMLEKQFVIKQEIKETVSMMMKNLLLSVILLIISFFFTSYDFNLKLFLSYLEPRLILLNLFPLLISMTMIYLITKRYSVAWIINFICIFLLGISNQAKLYYRDDVVKFEDLSLFKEALIMVRDGNFNIKSSAIIILILGIAIFIVIRKKKLKNNINLNLRIMFLITVFLGTIFVLKFVYFNKNLYNSIGNQTIVNKWIYTRQSQVKGLIYPFIYSITEDNYKVPSGYKKEKAINILNNYEDENIDENKKINIIAIMLEAYNDFSNYNKINFTEDIYEEFHKIANDSISGNIISYVYAGGTIVTEQNFLTGFKELYSFRKKTYSHVWYLKNQGYITEAIHPGYGSFYNRITVNNSLGFDHFFHNDNQFKKEANVSDSELFEFIKKRYKANTKDNNPYFSFTVTIQNHIPYSNEAYEGKEYYFENIYDLTADEYNNVNEYFSGIKKTNKSLKKLVDFFDEENNPTIILVFGDHNPFLGNNAIIYEKFGINMDVDTEDGFLNRYSIPYFIHANPTAEGVLNKRVVGEGNTISPIFLMTELYEIMGIKGDSFSQYLSEIKKKTPIIKLDSSHSNQVDFTKGYDYVNYYLGTTKYK